METRRMLLVVLEGGAQLSAETNAEKLEEAYELSTMWNKEVLMAPNKDNPKLVVKIDKIMGLGLADVRVQPDPSRQVLPVGVLPNVAPRRSH